MLEVPPLYDYLRHTGLPVGQRFGYDLFEFYQEGTEARYKAAYGVDMPDQNVTLKYGDAVYVDLNDDGVIDANDQKPLGYSENPEITWSVNASLNWKGLDFSMLWVGADNTSRTLNGYFRDQFGSTNTSALAQWVADNSWTEDNPGAILPRISFTNRVHNNRDSQAWIIDSKYVRLKNLAVLSLGFSTTSTDSVVSIVSKMSFGLPTCPWDVSISSFFVLKSSLLKFKKAIVPLTIRIKATIEATQIDINPILFHGITRLPLYK